MSRKKVKIAFKKGNEVIDAGFIKEIQNGIIIGKPGEPEHTTMKRDFKEGIDIHSKNQITGKYQTIPLLDILKYVVSEIVTYNDIEQFRREYQEAFITNYERCDFPESKPIDVTNEQHIFDLDNMIKSITEITEGLLTLKVKEFDFEGVFDGETHFILDLNEDGWCLYDLHRNGARWVLLDLTPLFSILNSMFGMALTDEPPNGNKAD